MLKAFIISVLALIVGNIIFWFIIYPIGKSKEPQQQIIEELQRIKEKQAKEGKEAQGRIEQEEAKKAQKRRRQEEAGEAQKRQEQDDAKEAQRRREQEEAKVEQERRLRGLEQEAKEEELKRKIQETQEKTQAIKRSNEERKRQEQVAQRKRYLEGQIAKAERNIKAMEARAAHEYQGNINEAESRRGNIQAYNLWINQGKNIRKIREHEIQRLRDELEHIKEEYYGLR